MLTCDCGASFEVRDAQPGQEVSCPECHHPVKVAPRTAGTVPRTSGLALASLMLALLGAFTILGTLAAIGVGLLAFAHVLSDRRRFKGLGLASAGVVLGAIFTVLALLLFLSRDGLGLGGKMRELSMASLLSPSGASEDELQYKQYTLTRPSEEWRKVRNNRSDNPAVYDFQRGRDLVLLHPAHHAYLDVRVDDKADNQLDLEQYDRRVLEDFDPSRQAPSKWAPGGADDDDTEFDEWGNPKRRRTAPKPNCSTRTIDSLTEPEGEYEGREFLIDVRGGGQAWRYIVWAYRRKQAFPIDPKKPAPVYVVRGYTPADLWEQNKDELYAALKSFRVGGRR